MRIVRIEFRIHCHNHEDLTERVTIFLSTKPTYYVSPGARNIKSLHGEQDSNQYKNSAFDVESNDFTSKPLHPRQLGCYHLYQYLLVN